MTPDNNQIMKDSELGHRHYHNDIKKWMLFVDGENLTIRAQELAKEMNIKLHKSPYYLKDTYIWPELMFQIEIHGGAINERPPIRSYYYTSVVGDDKKLLSIKERLWKIGFHPEVFKKLKGRKSKGVDIMLTKDALFHAFMNNYDMASIVTGDADYIPLIEEIKRQGKFVNLIFLENTKIDPKLVYSADTFDTIPVNCILSNTTSKYD